VAGLTVLSLVVADRRAGWLRALRPGWGAPLMLASVLPWFVAIGVATGGQFFADAVGGDLGRKLQSGDDAHWGPPGLHLLLLPVLLLPAAAALPGALRQAWRERTAPATRFLLAWIAPSWLVFEAVPTKLPHYTLPLYPAVALLAARWLLAAERRPMARAAGVAPVIVCVLLAAAVAAVPVLLGEPFWLGLPGAAAALLVAATFLPVLGRAGPGRLATERRATVAALAAMPFLYWAVLGGELPRLGPVWISPRVVAMMPAGPFGAVGFAEPSLMFLAGSDTRWLTPREGAQALSLGELRTLLVADRDLSQVLTETRKFDVQPLELGTIRGYNYSRGRFVTLTLLSDGKRVSTR